jgi:hypothetical protein
VLGAPPFDGARFDAIGSVADLVCGDGGQQRGVLS